MNQIFTSETQGRRGSSGSFITVKKRTSQGIINLKKTPILLRQDTVNIAKTQIVLQ